MTIHQRKEYWLRRAGLNIPFSTDYEGVAKVLAAALARQAEAEGVDMEDFGEKVDDPVEFARKALRRPELEPIVAETVEASPRTSRWSN